MDANELGRWTRFAGKGGIGKCVATQDCVAEASDDLMFLKDDEITVLMQLPGQDDLYLGYCEGVVGRFHGSFVRFQGRLKKPVMAKRSSTLPSSRPSSSLSTGTHGGRESRHSPSNPVPSPTSSSVVVLQRRVSDAAAHAAVTKPGTETVGPVQSSPLSPASIPPSADLAPTSPVLSHARTHSRGSASTASVYSPKMAATHQNDPPEMISLSSAFNDRVESPSDMEDDLDADESTTPDADSFRAPSQSPSPPPPQHIPQPKPLLDEPDPASASYMSSEPSARMSRISAMSDGEVGIGLTLLQNFMGGGDDSDSDSEEGERKSLYSDRDENENGVQDMSLVSDSTVEPLPEVEDDDEHEPNVADMSLDFPVPPEAPSPTSMHPSATDSEYGGGEEWEGASDIYDNYRYSRMSMASKMSRFSKASAFSLGVPPPVPTEGRPSMDSIRGMRERLGSSATTSSVDSALRSEQSKRVPAPLTFAPEITSSRNNSQDDQQQPQEAQQQAQGNTSPLLHTTFGSPLSSPTPLSTGGFVPTALASPIYATATNGAASLLRQRLEIERGSRPNSPPTEENPRGLGIMGLMSDTRARLSTQPIVMDDDESMPQITPPSNNTSFNSASMSMSMSPEQSNASMEPLSPPASRSNGMGSRDSTMSQSYLAEKQAMDSSFVIANPSPNPPPPYTPLSPTESSSSSFSHPPPPQTQPQPQPHPEPQSHPVGVPIARPRPAKPNANISPMARTSLFMPHPNAPKPAASPAGPMYGRPPSMDVNALLAGPPPGSVIHTLHAVLSMRYDGSPGSRRPTMYGMTEIDLSVAVGPVPIWFSVEPPQNVPAHRIKSPPAPTPLREGSPSLMQSASSSSQSSPQLGRPDMSRQGSDPGEVEGDARRVVPRANFFPKAPRPRSRSFSGFDSQIAEIELPKERVSEEQTKAEEMPVVQTKRSKSASATVTTGSANAATPQRASVSHTPPTARSVDRKPSPLSLSQNNLVLPKSIPPTSPPTRTSPLANPPVNAAPPTPVPPSSPIRPLNIVKSRVTSPSPSDPPSPLPSSLSFSIDTSPKVERSGTLPNPAISSSPPSSAVRRSRSSLSLHSRSRSRSSLQGRRSGETDTSQSTDTRNATSPPPFGSPPNGSLLGRNSSLRSKLSLPTLRIRSEKQASTDIGSPRSPTSSVATSEQDQRTVQVNEAEFEMVMPSGSLSPIPSATEDGFGLPPPSPINPDHSLRTGSPTLSVTSSTSANTRLRVAPTPTGTQPSPSPSKPPASPATAEAYRKRELNWISIISSIPASQSRKSKKVRKLLQDGVPSSVRYLVWAHLTDSKAKRIDGLYARLGKRERVAASASIERDAAMFVERHPQLQDASLGNLLQAYMTMVPDTQYSSGLVAIAGLILLQSPEEDAFWTFISLMDSHLRPYFSANPIQMEVDAALLVKCLEANEAALSKKLFVDMGISPSTICRAWFTALFVDMLPPEHLRRVWDIFLSEGVVFLFRAGLAIFCCCKQALLDANSHDAVMAILLNPPASILPSHADAFIEVAFSLKMKDDDIRKLRNKMEAQVKRNTQSRIDVSRPSISLPRT